MFRRIGLQVLLVGAGFLLTAGMLVYFASTYTTEFRPAPGGTYLESISGFPQSLNPLLSFYNDADSDVTSLVYSGLTQITMEGEIAPDLAIGWEIEPGGITYTFRLNPRALWHDGMPVSADDVLFTVGLLQDPDYPGPPDIGALWQGVRVERLGELAVRFVLPEPYAPFLDYTTFGLLPAHRLRGIRSADLATLDFNRDPVGTGPFRLAEVKAQDGQITEVTLKRFPRFYGAQAFIENVVLRFYPTPRAAFEVYQDGLVEGVAGVPINLLPEVWKNEALNLYTAPVAEITMLYFNELISATVPFDATPVRQALLYAIDRQALVDEVLLGQAIVPKTPLLPGTWAYSEEEVPAYPHNPAQAAALLRSVGWTRTFITETLRNADGTPLRFSLMVADEPTDLALGRALATQWAAVGISVTVQAVPPLALGASLQSRSYEAALIHIMAPGDPDPYPFWHETQALVGQNYTGFRHRRISELIEQARITVDRERRVALYREFQQLFMSEVPAIPLYVPVFNYAVDVRVQGVQMPPLVRTGDRFRNIAEWYVLQRRVVVSER